MILDKLISSQFVCIVIVNDNASSESIYMQRKTSVERSLCWSWCVNPRFTRYECILSTFRIVVTVHLDKIHQIFFLSSKKFGGCVRIYGFQFLFIQGRIFESACHTF